MGLLRSRSDLDFSVGDLPALPRGGRLLMAEPEFFEVQHVLNPHMAGNVGAVQPHIAHTQWRALRDTYRSLGLRVDVLPGEPLLPDYVFTANQVLPVPPGLADVGPAAFASLMADARRRAEVRPITRFLEDQGLAILRLDPANVRSLEGTGDGIWHPERAMLFAGVGPRSAEPGWETVAARLSVPVVPLELPDPRFYHLDTCLSPIDSRTALAWPGAFTSDGMDLLRAVFEDLIEVSEEDALRFACNGHCPDGRHFIVEAGSDGVVSALSDRGVEVLELETGEFLKSGGSVFCMKLQYWD